MSVCGDECEFDRGLLEDEVGLVKAFLNVLEVDVC